MTRRYEESDRELQRARRSIPLGAQTFSKSFTQLPQGAAPFFVSRAKGSRLWDVDGHEYIDFVSGLASILIGYGDPDVDAAVRTQLESGVTFSLSHPLERQVAEAVIERVPCADMVRFCKNGSDATAAAIRVARAATGRDHVITCGYHGWQDWTIGTTSRNKGVPEDVQALSHTFKYNDVASLDVILADHEGDVAAVILEPMSTVWPADDFLGKVRDAAHAAGALLIFDETITGFRLARGGAQERFGVTPDLATFGKGIANGFPLSLVCGRADVMAELEEVFVSTTFGGETLSLAAALAVMEKLDRDHVLEGLHARGETLVAGVAERIERHGVDDALSIGGHPTWSVLGIRDHSSATSWEIRTFFMQEVLKRGILTLGAHTLSHAHTSADVERLFDVYDEVFPALRAALDAGDLASRLDCEPLAPLFRVR